MKKFAMMMFALTAMMVMSPQMSHAGDYKHGGSFQHKVFKKIMMIKEYQEELNFSDADVQKAFDLKIALKKDLIKLDAELDVIKVDMHAAKMADKLDVEAYNTLIDKKYEAKKKKAKRLVKAYAEVKDMYSADQKKKMKEIYAEKKKQCKVCPMCAKKMKK